MVGATRGGRRCGDVSDMTIDDKHRLSLSGSRTVGLKRRGDEAAEANKRRPLDTKKRNVRCLPIEARPRSFHTEERRRNSRHEHHGSDRTEGPRRPDSGAARISTSPAPTETRRQRIARKAKPSAGRQRPQYRE